MTTLDSDVALPLDKLSLKSTNQDGLSSSKTRRNVFVALVSTGSFNPPTHMHLRCFELARDALNSQGFCVIGGYMSPVNDSYNKKGLLHAEHRVTMCDLACRSSDFVMVDPWEVSFSLSQPQMNGHELTNINTISIVIDNLKFTSFHLLINAFAIVIKFELFLCFCHFLTIATCQQASQDTYQRTLTVLSRVRTSLCESGFVSYESLKVMLVCGSDLLESFSIPGFWIREQVKIICRDFGLVCIRRGGQDVENIISNNDILNEFKENIKIVDEVIPNGISSTGLRDCISRGLSVKYLTADEVIDYIKQNNLYKNQKEDDHISHSSIAI